ncbi:hypothetical protein G7046_g9624 [Stylonectria norvegica]|nr:hypothetical protein G7046_g9624 [Stylonectria norvegica]
MPGKTGSLSDWPDTRERGTGSLVRTSPEEVTVPPRDEPGQPISRPAGPRRPAKNRTTAGARAWQIDSSTVAHSGGRDSQVLTAPLLRRLIGSRAYRRWLWDGLGWSGVSWWYDASRQSREHLPTIAVQRPRGLDTRWETAVRRNFTLFIPMTILAKVFCPSITIINQIIQPTSTTLNSTTSISTPTTTARFQLISTSALLRVKSIKTNNLDFAKYTTKTNHLQHFIIMSPIVARVARPAVRAVGRRQFSLLNSMRQVGRSMESHPFERLPVAQAPAKPDWGKEARRVGGQALFFFPGFAVVLGWPFAAEAIFDGHL